jgi:hypothetical protein
LLYLQYLALLRPYCYLSGTCLAENCSSQPDTFKASSSMVSVLADTADTVIRTPENELSYHSKQVEQFTNINKLYIVAFCWTIFDVYSVVIFRNQVWY